jgi:ribosomal protein L11 methyltransferase
MTADFLYRVALEVPKEFGGAFAEGLEAHVDSVSWTANENSSIADVHGFSEEQPDPEAVQLVSRLTAEALNLSEPTIEISKIPVRNWVLDNIKQFPPITAGRFFVHSAEYSGPVPPGKIGLRVPAGAAFGSGDHGSTKGCLLALDKMDHLPVNGPIRSALDMGCGSGILAIAMAKRWHIPVVASDIDPISTEVTRENAEINGVARYVRSLCAAGYQHPEIGARRYDLIVSNILARPLTRLAKDLGRHLKPGGWAVLSGLLLKDANRIISAHATQGLRLHSRVTLGEWGTLVLKKPT